MSAAVARIEAIRVTERWAANEADGGALRAASAAARVAANQLSTEPPGSTLVAVLAALATEALAQVAAGYDEVGAYETRTRPRPASARS